MTAAVAALHARFKHVVEQFVFLFRNTCKNIILFLLIDPTAFRGLTNLVELNLSGNLLTSVPTATFAGEFYVIKEVMVPIFKDSNI